MREGCSVCRNRPRGRSIRLRYAGSLLLIVGQKSVNFPTLRTHRNPSNGNALDLVAGEFFGAAVV